MVLKFKKIDFTSLIAFKIILNKIRVKFFEETFLVANVSPDVVLGMSFLTLSSVDIDFPKKELRWRLYTIEETLPITKRVKLVEKKEFTAEVLDLRHETFVVHVAFLESPSQEDDVHPSCRA